MFKVDANEFSPQFHFETNGKEERNGWEQKGGRQKKPADPTSMKNMPSWNFSIYITEFSLISVRIFPIHIK